MIDEKLLDREPPLPTVALAIAQLTSAQAARAFVVLSMTLIGAVMVMRGIAIPSELFGLYGLIVGSLFDTPQAPNGTKPR